MLRSPLSSRSPVRKTLTLLTLWSIASIGLSAIARASGPNCILEQLRSSLDATRAPATFTDEQKRALLKPFIDDGRPILVFTDAHYGQKSGVVTVMKNLKREVERLTDGKVKLEYVMPDQFRWKVKVPYQDLIFPLTSQKSIGEIIAKANPQAIHIMTEGTLGRKVRKYCLKNHIPFNTAYHTMWPEFARDTLLKFGLPRAAAELGSYLTNRSLKKFHDASVGILVYTKSMADALIRAGYDPAKIRYASLGVDSARFNPSLRDPNLYKGLKGPITVYAGRVAPEKSIPNFLKMNIPGTKVVIGGGPDLDKLKKKFPNAVFVGPQKPEDMGKYLASADYEVFPSVTDTLGLVQPEANAAGIPVAAYRVQGPIDMIVLPDQGQLADYNKKTPAQNVWRLEQAWYRIRKLDLEGKLDRRATRDAVQNMNWEHSALDFFWFLHRLPDERKPANAPVAASVSNH